MTMLKKVKFNLLILNPYMSYFDLYIKINKTNLNIQPYKSDLIARYDFKNYEKDFDDYSMRHITQQLMTE